MTVSNRSGVAHDGARSHGGVPQGTQGGPARGTEPVPDAPAAWPGSSGPAGDVAAAGNAGEVDVADLTAAEPESADLPLWDWSGKDSGQPDDPPEPAAEARTEPPRPEWKPVVTPVEEASREPGIGQRRGNLAHLARNPRMRVWRWRALVAVIVLVAFSIITSWQVGLTLAVIVVIADTIYRSRKNYSGQPRLTGAQRRTRRQLGKLDRAGYRAMHSSPIPETEEQIDHLVVGPTGVFAIDSEAWDKHLVVRTKKGTQLWHGPFSKKDRLEHAQWEAQRAADLLSGEIGKPVSVRPAMAVYGPRIPWDVATIRDVDVFSGPRLRKYLRRRARQEGVRLLSHDEIEKIYQAAGKTFPHLSSGSPAR